MEDCHADHDHHEDVVQGLRLDLDVELLHAHVHDTNNLVDGVADAVRPWPRLSVVLATAFDDADLGRLDALDAAGHLFLSGSRRGRQGRLSWPRGLPRARASQLYRPVGKSFQAR